MAVCALWITTFHFLCLHSTCDYEKFDLWPSIKNMAFIPKFHCGIGTFTPSKLRNKRKKKFGQTKSKSDFVRSIIRIIGRKDCSRFFLSLASGELLSRGADIPTVQTRAFYSRIKYLRNASKTKPGLLLGIFASFHSDHNPQCVPIVMVSHSKPAN